MERRLGGWPYGEQRGVMQEGWGSDLVRAGEIFFSSFLVGPRITNPIRTSPPGYFLARLEQTSSN